MQKKGVEGEREIGLVGSQYNMGVSTHTPLPTLHTAPYLNGGYLVGHVDHMDCDIDVFVNVHSSPTALATTIINSN